MNFCQKSATSQISLSRSIWTTMMTLIVMTVTIQTLIILINKILKGVQRVSSHATLTLRTSTTKP